MMKWLYIFAFVILVSTPLCSTEHVPRRPKTEYEILDTLLDTTRYDPRIRPAGTNMQDSAVVVRVSLYVIDVYQEDPYLKEFKIQCYFRQRWFDNRLVYPGGGDGLVNLQDINRIWTPDLFIPNEIALFSHSPALSNTHVAVSYNGQVLLSTRLTAILKCKTNLKFYPHDQQVCQINIESFGSYATDLLLQWDTHPHVSGFNKNVSNDQYNLLDFATYESVKYSQKVEYTILHADLMFSRKFGTFLWNLYLPYIMFIVLSWGSFYLQPKKLILRLAFLALILILMLHFSPKSHDFKKDVYSVTALDFWVWGCLGFLVAAFLEYLYIHSLISNNNEGDSPSEECIEELEDGTMTNKEKLEAAMKILKSRSALKSYWKNWVTNANRIDKTSRYILFPLTFVIFNILYWSICFSCKYASIDGWNKAVA